MRFSVITITKNNKNGFQKTKQSIELQSYSDFEWIVIDGDIEPDNGIYDAMNKGVNRACGDYVIFMNAGDVFADPHVLKDLSAIDADFIYGHVIEEGYVRHAKPVARMNGGMITSHQAMIYKRSVIGDLRYDEAYQIAADYKFTLQFLDKAAEIVSVDFPICSVETGGVSQRYAVQGRREEQAIRRETGRYSPFIPLRQWLALFVKSISYRLYLVLRTA